VILRIVKSPVTDSNFYRACGSDLHLEKGRWRVWNQSHGCPDHHHHSTAKSAYRWRARSQRIYHLLFLHLGFLPLAAGSMAATWYYGKDGCWTCLATASDWTGHGHSSAQATEWAWGAGGSGKQKMTNADFTVWGNASDEAKSQPAHVCGWKDHATLTLLLWFLVFFKGYYFPRRDKAGQPQVSDTADLWYILTPPLSKSNVPLLLCFLGSPGFVFIHPCKKTPYFTFWVSTRSHYHTYPWLAEALSFCNAKSWTSVLMCVHLHLQCFCSLSVWGAEILDSWSVAGVTSQPKMPSAPTLWAAAQLAVAGFHLSTPAKTRSWLSMSVYSFLQDHV